MSDPVRELAEEIAKEIARGTIHYPIDDPDHWEARLRTDLPSLTSLLGELGVLRGALKDYASRCPDCPGDGIRRGPEGDPEECQWCDAARSALAGDAGGRAGEVLTFVGEMRSLAKEHPAPISGPELAELWRRWDALLAAVPGLRGEVELAPCPGCGLARGHKVSCPESPASIQVTARKESPDGE